MFIVTLEIKVLKDLIEGIQNERMCIMQSDFLSLCHSANRDILYDLAQSKYIDRLYSTSAADYEISVTLAGREYVRSFYLSRINTLISLIAAIFSIIAAILAFAALF